ncbi:MAG: glycine--tRNA ligase [Nitrospirae bacterium]|nr:glycine--tRNA ligase [Nitrospirota bacterium]
MAVPPPDKSEISNLKSQSGPAGVTLDTIVSLCKRRGFVFQSSEIYGGIGSTWDWGPLGVEFKRNIKDAWWKAMVHDRDDMEGIDAAIIMNPKVWEASGHIAGFHDPMVECKACHHRFREDHLKEKGKCPDCGGEVTPPRQFSLMFKTNVGPVEDTSAIAYLRPETAQGIFVNFDNVLTTSRRKLPFGIAQIGKAFRNEITPGNFVFRSREFEQMEIEFFVRPGTDEDWHRRWVEDRLRWYTDLGIRPESLRKREHGKDELAHYAKACVDLEFEFPMGWSELEGIANRTDFDLKQHTKFSGKTLSFFDEEKKDHVVPFVIEPSAGVDRSALAFLVHAYTEEKVKDEKRVSLKLHPTLAPIQAAILPLLRNRPDVVETARKLYTDLKRRIRARYDDTGSIGRLYRRQDEIGTPFCITVDVQTLTDQKVTVRDRDTMLQDRIGLDSVGSYLETKLGVPKV